tara:strand:- start:176 stop:418 length:243 start_codon:yes stop_codon:yes gene_type:complete
MPTSLNDIKGALSSVAKISEVFKGDNKKWSAKRSVSGVLIGSVVHDVSIQGVTWMNCLMAFIAVLPLIFAAMEKKYLKKE